MSGLLSCLPMLRRFQRSGSPVEHDEASKPAPTGSQSTLWARVAASLPQAARGSAARMWKAVRNLVGRITCAVSPCAEGRAKGGGRSPAEAMPCGTAAAKAAEEGPEPALEEGPEPALKDSAQPGRRLVSLSKPAAPMAAPSASQSSVAVSEAPVCPEYVVGQKVVYKPAYQHPHGELVGTVLAPRDGTRICLKFDMGGIGPVDVDRVRPFVEKAAAPPLPKIHRTQADAIAAHVRAFPPVKITALAMVEAHCRIGAYVKLGRTYTVDIRAAFGGWVGAPLDAGVKQAHAVALRGASDEQRSCISHYVSYCGGNELMRKGQLDDNLRNLSRTLHELALPLPPGTELKRNLSDFENKERLLDLQPGDIIQSPQFESLALPDGKYGEPEHLSGKTSHAVQLRLVTGAGVRGLYIKIPMIPIAARACLRRRKCCYPRILAMPSIRCARSPARSSSRPSFCRHLKVPWNE